MEDTQPKAFVLVLMPFNENFRDIYEVGIKPACKDAGAYCERVDEQIFVQNIMERLYNQIAKADVIVAEMTGRNPNVFYEVGYAHALNKQVILLTQTADDIPFDLKHYPHIVYGGSIATLKSELETRVRWCVENPKEALSSVDMDLEFVLNGSALVDSPQIKVQDTADYANYAFLYFTVAVHNKMNTTIDSDDFGIALMLPFKRITDNNTEGFSPVRSITQQPDGPTLVHLDSPTSVLFPDSWTSFDVRLVGGYNNDDDRKSWECSLRLFTKVGPKDFPFELVVDDS